MHFTANKYRHTEDNARNCKTGNECNADWSADQRAQLPEQFFLARPRFLAPKCATGWTETHILYKTTTISRLPKIMQITNLFETKPTEFGTAQCTDHMITRAIVHLDNVGTTAWTCFDIASYKQQK